jgi:hypothetical protein
VLVHEEVQNDLRNLAGSSLYSANGNHTHLFHAPLLSSAWVSYSLLLDWLGPHVCIISSDSCISGSSRAGCSARDSVPGACARQRNPLSPADLCQEQEGSGARPAPAGGCFSSTLGCFQISRFGLRFPRKQNPVSHFESIAKARLAIASKSCSRRSSSRQCLHACKGANIPDPPRWPSRRRETHRPFLSGEDRPVPSVPGRPACLSLRPVHTTEPRQ